MLNCPACVERPLEPTLLDDHLSAHGCPACNGALLSLVTYRNWRELHGGPDPGDGDAPLDPPTAESTGALRCPHCSGVMTKYRIDARSDRRLDYCARCEDVWLDAGEWAAVHALARCGDVTRVFTSPWQRRIRMERSARREEAQMEALLGGDYRRLVEFDAWLADHTARDRILAFLQRSR